jgi:hypothetical protein
LGRIVAGGGQLGVGQVDVMLALDPDRHVHRSGVGHRGSRRAVGALRSPAAMLSGDDTGEEHCVGENEDHGEGCNERAA